MTDNKKNGKYTEEDMQRPQIACDHDRVKSGWKNVVEHTIKNLNIASSELTMIDVGSHSGKKSLKKYVAMFDLLSENMAAIEGDPTVLDTLRKNVPGVTVFPLDFSKTSLKKLNIQKRYHMALLCEVLEHLPIGEDQMRVLRETAELVEVGGGMHVTFPKVTNVEDPKSKPWGHKCREVPRHDVMNILTAHFETVTWGKAGGGCINFFALGRKA